ncbi:MAG: rubredoxin, partial [Desulfobacterales bacterium]|nr:rubredoxin [Desulfobacterales bacterium]
AIVLTLPVVLFTGLVEWKIKYGGKLTKIFKQKIISAIAVTVLTIILLVWSLIYPMDSDAPNMMRYSYALTALILLIPTAIAGNIGGKLVFKEFGK